MSRKVLETRGLILTLCVGPARERRVQVTLEKLDGHEDRWCLWTQIPLMEFAECLVPLLEAALQDPEFAAGFWRGMRDGHAEQMREVESGKETEL